MPELVPPSQMRALGIIGGSTWQSTLAYFRYINSSVNLLYGNQTNPPLVLYNLNRAYLHVLQRAEAWGRIAEIFREASLRLEAVGCRGLLFAFHTAHRVLDEVAKEVSVPILHIGDAIGGEVRQGRFGTVGLLGTLFAMEHDFISRRLLEGYSVQALPPASAASRVRLHAITEQGSIPREPEPESKRFILDEIARLQARGAQAIVLGCAASPLIVSQEDMDLPILNTTLAHARLAVDFILGAGFE